MKAGVLRAVLLLKVSGICVSYLLVSDYSWFCLACGSITPLSATTVAAAAAAAASAVWVVTCFCAPHKRASP